MTEPEEPDEPLPTSEDWGRMIGSQRGDQYTPMGEVWMLGDFASGTRRTNLPRWVGVSIVVLAVIAVLLVVVLVVS